MQLNELSLEEKLRPSLISELNLPAKTIKRFEYMKTTGNISNMLFYGQPGIGKTSAARILSKDFECYEIVTYGKRSDAILKNIDEYASRISLWSTPKIVIIDEADTLDVKVLENLKSIIENSKTCRFIMTTNHLNKFPAAMRSRLEPISFDVAVSDRSAVIKNMINRYANKLPEHGLTVDEEMLEKIVKTWFPDLRAVAQRLEAEFKNFELV